MKISVGLATCALFASFQVSAADSSTVYLDCEMDGNPWQVSLNESAARLTYKHKNGIVFEQAVFTADAVTWQTRLGLFSISRTDLTLTFDIGGQVSKGSCVVVPVPKRAF